MDYGEPTAAINRTVLKGHLIIEKYFQNLPITELAEDAFYRCYLLTKLTIKADIKVIPRGCFADCYNLNYIDLPNSIETIQERGIMFWNVSGTDIDRSLFFSHGSCTVRFRRGSKLNVLGPQVFAYKSQVVLFFETPVHCSVDEKTFKAAEDVLIYSVYLMKLGNYSVIYRDCSCIYNIYFQYLEAFKYLGLIIIFL